MTSASRSDPEADFPKDLPCPHCGEPIPLQFVHSKLPIRCPRCRQHSVFPLETRRWQAGLLVAAAIGTVLLIKILSLDSATSLLGIGAKVAILLLGLVVGAWLVGRSTRKTATHLVKSRPPFLWFR